MDPCLCLCVSMSLRLNTQPPRGERGLCRHEIELLHTEKATGFRPQRPWCGEDLRGVYVPAWGTGYFCLFLSLCLFLCLSASLPLCLSVSLSLLAKGNALPVTAPISSPMLELARRYASPHAPTFHLPTPSLPSLYSAVAAVMLCTQECTARTEGDMSYVCTAHSITCLTV